MKTAAIIWSARFDVENGQAIVTRRVYELENVRWRECVYRGGGGVFSYLSWIVAIFRLFFFSLTDRHVPIYAVVSRSDAGFLRDVPVLAMALFGKRVICHFHGSDVLNLFSESRLRKLVRYLYRNCVLIVPSEHLLVPLKEMSGAVVIVCENPAVLQYPVPASEGKTASSDMPILIWNSNMVASKGFVNTLLAVGEINADRRKIDFVTLGRGLGDDEMSAEEISTLLASFEHEPWLHLVGAVSSEDALEHTLRSDIVALPSWYRSECQPLAIMQAMCLRKTIVSSPIPAMKATLGDYPAFIAEEPTVPSVRNAIVAAIESIRSQNNVVYIDEALSEKARIRFSPERFDNQITALLSNENEKNNLQ